MSLWACLVFEEREIFDDELLENIKEIKNHFSKSILFPVSFDII